jgi:hypothetical protein
MAIKKADLVDGAYYRGRCRNAEVARWFKDAGVFTHWRVKFGARFLEDIKCAEDEAVFDVFFPHEAIGEPADGADKIPHTAKGG